MLSQNNEQQDVYIYIQIYVRIYVNIYIICIHIYIFPYLFYIHIKCRGHIFLQYIYIYTMKNPYFLYALDMSGILFRGDERTNGDGISLCRDVKAGLLMIFYGALTTMIRVFFGGFSICLES